MQLVIVNGNDRAKIQFDAENSSADHNVVFDNDRANRSASGGLQGELQIVGAISRRVGIDQAALIGKAIAERESRGADQGGEQGGD